MDAQADLSLRLAHVKGTFLTLKLMYVQRSYTALMPNTKYADQPAHPRSLTRIFCVRTEGKSISNNQPTLLSFESNLFFYAITL